MKKIAPYVSHEVEQLREFRKHPDRAIEYLNSCILVAFEENDPELVLIALATVAKAYGMTHVAREAALKRESLHRMLSRRGNPEWNSMFRVFKALHLRPKLERATIPRRVRSSGEPDRHGHVRRFCEVLT